MTRCYAWPLTVGAGADLKLHVSTGHRRFGVRLFRFGGDGDAGRSAGRRVRRARAAARPAGRGVGLATVLDRPGRIPARRHVPGRTRAGRAGSSPETSRPARSSRSGPMPACSSCAAGSSRPGSGTSCRSPPTRPTTSSAGPARTRGRTGHATGPRRATSPACSGRATAARRPGDGRRRARRLRSRTSRRQVFAHWDAPFVSWLERRGYEVGYCTDYELHRRARLLAGAGLLRQRRARRVLERSGCARKVAGVRGPGRQRVFLRRRCGLLRGRDFSRDRLFCPKMAGGSPESRGQADRGAVARQRPAGVADHVQRGLRRRLVGRPPRDHAYQPLVASHWVFDGVRFRRAASAAARRPRLSATRPTGSG